MDFESKELLKEIRDLLKVNNEKLDDIKSELSSIYIDIPLSVDYDETTVVNYISSVEEKVQDVYELLAEQLIKE